MSNLNDALQSVGGPEQTTEAVAAYLQALDSCSIDAVKILVKGITHVISHHPERRTDFDGLYEPGSAESDLLRALLAARSIAIKNDSVSALLLRFLQDQR